MEENEFENTNQDEYTEDVDEVTEETSDDACDTDTYVVPTAVMLGIGGIIGFLAYKYAVPAVKGAFASAADFVQNKIQHKDYTEVDTDNSDKEAQN